MKVGVINSRELARFDRMDASFLLLAQEHKEAAKELAAKFTREEIISIAKELPYNEAAANCVKPGAERCIQSQFMEWLERKNTRLTDVIVYVAAAACDAGRIVMEGILAERRKQVEKLQRFRDVVARIESKSSHLASIIKFPGPEAKDRTDV
jgi:hypothetical protein